MSGIDSGRALCSNASVGSPSVEKRARCRRGIRSRKPSRAGTTCRPSSTSPATNATGTTRHASSEQRCCAVRQMRWNRSASGVSRRTCHAPSWVWNEWSFRGTRPRGCVRPVRPTTHPRRRRRARGRRRAAIGRQIQQHRVAVDFEPVLSGEIRCDRDHPMPGRATNFQHRVAEQGGDGRFARRAPGDEIGRIGIRSAQNDAGPRVTPSHRMSHHGRRFCRNAVIPSAASSEPNIRAERAARSSP